MAQVYSGRKYSLFLGRQTDASTPIAMGTAQSTNGEFVELDVVSVTDIDFTGGLVTDRTLRTGQQVKRLTDHFVSEKEHQRLLVLSGFALIKREYKYYLN